MACQGEILLSSIKEKIEIVYLMYTMLSITVANNVQIMKLIVKKILGFADFNQKIRPDGINKKNVHIHNKTIYKIFQVRNLLNCVNGTNN